MKRRSFLQVLASIPILGRVVPSTASTLNPDDWTLDKSKARAYSREWKEPYEEREYVADRTVFIRVREGDPTLIKGFEAGEGRSK